MSWLKDATQRRIKNDVKEAIDNAYSDVKEGVKVKLAKELEDVDLTQVKDEVVERAAEKANEKFDKEFKKLIGSYDSKLSNIFDVYSSTLKSFVRTQSSSASKPWWWD